MHAFEEEIMGRGDVPPALQQVTPFSADSGASISLGETSIGFQVGYRFP